MSYNKTVPYVIGGVCILGVAFSVAASAIIGAVTQVPPDELMKAEQHKACLEISGKVYGEIPPLDAKCK